MKKDEPLPPHAQSEEFSVVPAKPGKAKIVFPKEEMYKYGLFIDPGPCNMGWAALNLETGMVVAAGVHHFFARLLDMPAPDARGMFFARKMAMDVQTAQKVPLAWTPFPNNPRYLVVGIEDQIMMDRDRHCSHRVQTLMVEAAFHFMYAGRNFSVNAGVYKKHFGVTNDKRGKPLACGKARDFIPKDMQVVDSVTGDAIEDHKFEHVADAVLMGRYFWETQYKPQLDKVTTSATSASGASQPTGAQ